MLEPLRKILDRLRTSFSGQAERAYEDRDAEDEGSQRAAYAAGESHAFGVASDEVRQAEDDNESLPSER